VHRSIEGVDRLQEVLSDEHSRVCLHVHFSQEAQEVRALPKAMRAGEKCEPFKRDWMKLVNFFLQL